MRSRIVPFDHVSAVELDPEYRAVIPPRLKVPPKAAPVLKRDVGFNRKRRTWEKRGVNFDKFLAEAPDNLDDFLVVESEQVDLPENLDEILVPEP